MRALTFFLSIAAILFSGCGNKPSNFDAAVSSVPLSFYVVSDEKIEGGQFIDTADLPKLGYIAAAADLVVTELEKVVLDPSGQGHRSVMEDKDGKQTVMPTRPTVEIRMQAEDAKRFSALTKKAVGQRVLLMLGDTPLIAPTVHTPISTPSLLITLGTQTNNTKVVDGLKRLVR